jgi:hypothetical protein
VQIAAASKFDLMLFHFQQGVQELAARIISLYASEMSKMGIGFMDERNRPHTLTPEMLKGRYIYRAIGTSQTANPQTRTEQSLAKRQVAGEYLMLKAQQPMNPDLKYHWHNAREVLLDMGDHRPETRIGPEPEPMPAPMPGMPGMPGAPGMMNGATNGAGNGFAPMAVGAPTGQPGVG